MARRARTARDATKSAHLGDLPTEFLRCRTFGHAWEEFIPVGMRNPEFGFRYSLLCTSCGSERHELIDTNGNVAHRGYYYPDGYQLRVKAKRDEARLLYDARRRKRQSRRGNLTREGWLEKKGS